jgi:carbon monoxide dehydrogenase subunit G
MAQVNVSRQIAAPQEKVWAVLASPARFEEWLTLHTKWKQEPPAELSAGASMTEVVTIMGMANTITWTVDSYAPPASLKISGTGMAGAKVAFTLSVQAEGSSCAATIDAEFISQMMTGAIGDAVERNAVKELGASLDKLATLVA